MSSKPKVKGPIKKRIIKPGEKLPPRSPEMVSMPLEIAELTRDLIFRMSKMLGFRDIDGGENSFTTMEELNDYLDKLEAGDNGDPDGETKH
jgi:hypothetical protein